MHPEILYQVRNDYAGHIYIYDTFDNYDAAKEELEYLAEDFGDSAGFFISRIPLNSQCPDPENITREVFND